MLPDLVPIVPLDDRVRVTNIKCGKNFRTAPYLIMHVHLTGDTLNNKAPYMDV